MITVSGILKTPAGAVLANTEIKFYAVVTGSNVLQGTTGLITTGSDGSYSVTLQQGSHRVTVRQGNTRPETIGLVHISADTTASTLNELLLAASAASPGNPLADEVLAARDRAETAASAAEASRAAAQQIKTDTAAIRDQTSQISGLDTVEQAIDYAMPDALAKADPTRHPFRGKLPSLALEFSKNRYHLVGDYGLEPQQLTDVMTISNGASTRVDHRGLPKLTAINQAVINYDPLTGQCLGLSVNPAHTNISTWSEKQDHPYWDKNGACTVDQIEAFGDISAFRINGAASHQNSGGANNLRQASFALTVGLTYTANAYIRIINAASLARFRVVGSSGDLHSSTTELKLGEYVRISVTFTASATAGRLIFADVMGYSFDLAGVWITQSPFVSRYIKTEDSTVTRVADYPTVDSAVFTPAFNPHGFTVLVEYDAQLEVADSTVIAMDDSNTDQTKALDLRFSSTQLRLRMLNSGVQPFPEINFGGSATNGTGRHKVAFSISPSVVNAAIDGVGYQAIPTQDVLAVTSLFNRLRLGHRGSLNGTQRLVGNFYTVTLFSHPMTLAEVEALAA